MSTASRQREAARRGDAPKMKPRAERDAAKAAYAARSHAPTAIDHLRPVRPVVAPDMGLTGLVMTLTALQRRNPRRPVIMVDDEPPPAAAKERT